MYQVWTKAQYEENWKLTECPDIAAVELIIRDNFSKEVEVKVSLPVEFDARITVKVHAPTGPAGEPTAMAAVEKRLKEVEKSEVAKAKAEPGKGPGAKSEGKVRPGDTSPVPELGKGSRDPGAGDLLPGR